MHLCHLKSCSPMLYWFCIDSKEAANSLWSTWVQSYFLSSNPILPVLASLLYVVKGYIIMIYIVQSLFPLFNMSILWIKCVHSALAPNWIHVSLHLQCYLTSITIKKRFWQGMVYTLRGCFLHCNMIFICYFDTECCSDRHTANGQSPLV